MEQQNHLVGHKKLLKLISIAIYVLSNDFVNPDKYIRDEFCLKIMMQFVNYQREIYVHLKWISLTCYYVGVVLCKMGFLGTHLSPVISCMMILCMHENSLSFGLEVEDIKPLRGMYSGLGIIKHRHSHRHRNNLRVMGSSWNRLLAH